VSSEIKINNRPTLSATRLAQQCNTSLQGPIFRGFPQPVSSTLRREENKEFRRDSSCFPFHIATARLLIAVGNCCDDVCVCHEGVWGMEVLPHSFLNCATL
jgi:hypothetical protein